MNENISLTAEEGDVFTQMEATSVREAEESFGAEVEPQDGADDNRQASVDAVARLLEAEKQTKP